MIKKTKSINGRNNISLFVIFMLLCFFAILYSFLTNIWIDPYFGLLFVGAFFSAAVSSFYLFIRRLWFLTIPCCLMMLVTTWISFTLIFPNRRVDYLNILLEIGFPVLFYSYFALLIIMIIKEKKREKTIADSNH